MDPANKIYRIEKLYDVEKIQVENVPVWQFLRNVYYDLLCDNNYQINTPSIIPKVKNKISNFFWQYSNHQKKYPSILLTDILEEKKIEGKYSDKIAFNILNILPDTLIIQNLLGEKHHHINEYFHNNILSMDAVIGIRPTLIKKYKIKNQYILDQINDELNMKLNYTKMISSFFNYVKIFNKKISQFQPKIIFINCYYSALHQPIIYAAKQKNILTVEMQHGVISKNQLPYILSENIGKQTYPDYFLSFGEIEKNIISSNFINKKNIIPIGHFYLEFIKNRHMNNNQIQLKKQYKKIITISSQNIIEKQLLQFIIKSAEMAPEICFIFIPRRYCKFYSNKTLPDNILINEKYDLYSSAMFSDYHATVFSTFATESLFLGVPTIMINIDNLSKIHFGDILGNNKYVQFINEPNELVALLDKKLTYNKVDVEQSSKTIFTTNNLNSIQTFLKKIHI